MLTLSSGWFSRTTCYVVILPKTHHISLNGFALSSLVESMTITQYMFPGWRTFLLPLDFVGVCLGCPVRGWLRPVSCVVNPPATTGTSALRSTLTCRRCVYVYAFFSDGYCWVGLKNFAFILVHCIFGDFFQMGETSITHYENICHLILLSYSLITLFWAILTRNSK